MGQEGESFKFLCENCKKIVFDYQISGLAEYCEREGLRIILEGAWTAPSS